MFNFNSEGILKYGPGLTASVLVDNEIARYYRNWIPKYYYAAPQMYPAHITVVRLDREVPSNMGQWGLYSGEIVPFVYSGEIQFDGQYFYLNVQSKRIAEIRQELGLPVFRFVDVQCYHITIANIKGQ